MAFSGFAKQDFEVFEIDDFDGRMGTLRARITPKLRALGEDIAPALVDAAGAPVFAHVALHARRRVNPPDDTWVAFGPNARGYKKYQHFKVAISRAGLRFLFEVGPEYEDKAGLRDRFAGAAPKVKALRALAGLGFYADEHDEEPAKLLADLAPAGVKVLGDSLTARKDGQLVIGRGLARADVLAAKPGRIADRALETFRALAPLYRLGAPV